LLADRARRQPPTKGTSAGNLDPTLDPGYVFVVFGLGFGEMVVLGIVLLVVVGPKELPKLLRSVGRGINKLKTMSQDLRDQSGIDDILEDEGLREDLQAIRSIARPGAAVAGLVNSSTKSKRKPVHRRPAVRAPELDDLQLPDSPAPDRLMEHPLEGPDAYGALADDAPEAPANEDADDDAADAADASDGTVPNVAPAAPESPQNDADDDDDPTSTERPTGETVAAATEGT
jgi:sec-independent protein translocase protein TatB